MKELIKKLLKAKEILMKSKGPDWTDEQWENWFNIQSPEVQKILLETTKNSWSKDILTK